jgi:hypothetical protein
LSLIFPAMWNREREKEIGRVWLGGLLFEYWLQRERETVSWSSWLWFCVYILLMEMEICVSACWRRSIWERVWLFCFFVFWS